LKAAILTSKPSGIWRTSAHALPLNDLAPGTINRQSNFVAARLKGIESRFQVRESVGVDLG
jgi:hypothetical protein